MAGLPERVSTASGVVAPALLLATVAVGAVLAPAYEWPTDPFSLVGTLGGPLATAFNAGIALSGVAALGFARRLLRTRGRAVGGCYAAVGVGLVGGGLLPAIGPTRPLHEAAGVVVLLGIPVLLWVAGAADWRAGRRRAGTTTLAVGTAVFGVWLPYDLGVTWAQVGYGAAELAAFLAFGAWSVRAALRSRERPDGRGADVEGTPG